jgi:homocysteine S-methyltransferase
MPCLPTLWYAIQPPKIIGSTPTELERSLTTLYSRAVSLRNIVDRLLVTSPVLDTPRLPSIFTAASIKRKLGDLWVGCSIRTGDYLLHQAFKVVSEAITYYKMDGILLVYGDLPQYGSRYPNHPSLLLKILRQFIRLSGTPKIYLTAPSSRNEEEVMKKIEAKPDGFITQIVTEVEQISWLIDVCKSNSIELIATLLAPTPKNSASAEKIGLRWQPDEAKAMQLAQTLFKEGVSILLASPASFKDGLEFATKLKAYK